MLLTAVEARVLGSLMEKETTTPEVYPLSLNALVAACNQKSSREPVMQLPERDVHAALRLLEDKNLVSVDHGSRVERFENRARTVFALRRDEAALLCLLLLRGPQTPGELRGRAERLFAFDEVAAVLAALHRMAEPVALEGSPRREPLTLALPRQPGSREQRYTHLLCGAPEIASAAVTPMPETRGGGPVQQEEEEPLALRALVLELQDRVAELEQACAAAGLMPGRSA